MIIIIFSDYVSPACVPLGVADRNTIPDARMTGSTYHDSRYHPSYGRLNGKRGKGGWCAKTPSDRTDYLQVDMGAVSSVCAVETQGIRVAWVSTYKLHFSVDGVTWNNYKENNVFKVSTLIDCCLPSNGVGWVELLPKHNDIWRGSVNV